MNVYRVKLSSLLVIAVMTTAFLQEPAQAEGNNPDEERAIRLYVTATAGPIGSVQSFAPLIINGRPAQYKQSIWGGALVEAGGKNAQVSFDGIGRAVLASGAIVRFATARRISGDDAGSEVLVASVIRGELALTLKEQSGAYVEACGSAFSAKGGAAFRIGIRDGQAFVSETKGEVSQVQTAQRNYRIRPIKSGLGVTVRARATRQIQVQVTDENDRPVPDVPVIFALGPGDGGTLGSGQSSGASVTVTTNPLGVASSSFTAGTTAGTSSVTATVAGTSISTTIGVTTTVATGIITGTTIGIIAGAAAAGTVATVVVVNAQNDENVREPINAAPPNIRPRP